MSKLKPKVLVIEDDLFYQRILNDKLSRAGFSVVSALDGEEGLKLLLKDKPDLLVLDIRIPKIDGITLLNKIREMDNWGQRLPVIVITAMPDFALESFEKSTNQKHTYFYQKTQTKIKDIIDKALKLVN